MNISENHVISFFSFFVDVTLVLLFKSWLHISINSRSSHFILNRSSERSSSSSNRDACVVNTHNFIRFVDSLVGCCPPAIEHGDFLSHELTWLSSSEWQNGWFSRSCYFLDYLIFSLYWNSFLNKHFSWSLFHNSLRVYSPILSTLQMFLMSQEISLISTESALIRHPSLNGRLLNLLFDYLWLLPYEFPLWNIFGYYFPLGRNLSIHLLLKHRSLGTFTVRAGSFRVNTVLTNLNGLSLNHIGPDTLYISAHEFIWRSESMGVGLAV